MGGKKPQKTKTKKPKPIVVKHKKTSLNFFPVMVESNSGTGFPEKLWNLHASLSLSNLLWLNLL